MKQVNIDITDIVHQVALSGFGEERYRIQLKEHGDNATIFFLKRFRNMVFKKNIGKDKSGKNIIVSETMFDIIKNRYNVSRSTAAQTMINLERKE